MANESKMIKNWTRKGCRRAEWTGVVRRRSRKGVGTFQGMSEVTRKGEARSQAQEHREERQGERKGPEGSVFWGAEA